MKRMGMSAMALSMALAACGGGGSNAPSSCGAGLGAHTFSGTVTGVHDGDTLTHSAIVERVRLQGIDAPELAQTGGTESKQALQALVLNQTVTVVYDQRDSYGRVLGHVFRAGCEHTNLRLVREGMAWYYRAYACDLPASLRSQFNQAELSAQQQHLGLWAQTNPVAPWYFRNGENAPEPVCTN